MDVFSSGHVNIRDDGVFALISRPAMQ